MQNEEGLCLPVRAKVVNEATDSYCFPAASVLSRNGTGSDCKDPAHPFF